MATTYDPTTADAGALVAVPREKLVIDPNVRTSIGLDKSFISSIRQYGIHQPPVGWRDEDGLVHITMGQRRTSAALEIGHPVVHVIVKPRDTAEGDAADERRIITQLAENEQRLSLNAGETAAAYQQLALFGLTEERIARKTNAPKSKVASAIKVASSPAAASAAEAHSLTLDQAALIAEFDDDEDDRRLLEEQATEDPEQLEHVAARIREERLDREVVDRIAKELTDIGVQPVRDWADMPAGVEYWNRLGRLVDGEKMPLDLEELKDGTVQSVVGYIRSGYRGDADRGWSVQWYVSDWKAQGLVLRYGTESPSAEQTEEEKEAKKVAAREKRETRKEMRAATLVRREWIRTTLLSTRTRFNETHLAWIAGSILEARGHLTASDTVTFDLVYEMLGHEMSESDRAGWTTDPETGEWTSPHAMHAARVIRVDRATRVALAAAIARTEGVVGNEKHPKFGEYAGAAIYLGQLRDWGYALSAVERAIVEAADARREAEAERVAATAAADVETGEAAE